MTFEINTVLMQSTPYLEGNGPAPNTLKYGSGVIVRRPCGASAPDKSRYVLVTAAHVLSGFSGDAFALQLPVRANDGRWVPVHVRVPLRDSLGKLWTEHPTADVAAIDVNIPIGSAEPPVLSAEMFATDETLNQFEIHPGDEVMTLGYPLRTSGNGFPLLRSGRISSFPLTPQKETQTFLVDMEVLPGNSGGPVYFVDRNRTYGDAVHIGEVRFLMGIITQMVLDSTGQTPLRVAKVAHASLVLETIAMMPPPKC